MDKLIFEVVAGSGGNALYVNDYRVAGGKPWGGGSVRYSWAAKPEDFIKDIQSATNLPEFELIQLTKDEYRLKSERYQAKKRKTVFFKKWTDETGEYFDETCLPVLEEAELKEYKEFVEILKTVDKSLKSTRGKIKRTLNKMYGMA